MGEFSSLQKGPRDETGAVSRASLKRRQNARIAILSQYHCEDSGQEDAIKSRVDNLNRS